MITLIIRIEGTSVGQRICNLTLKELGTILMKFGEKYHLVFETIRDVEPDVGCTMLISAIEKS